MDDLLGVVFILLQNLVQVLAELLNGVHCVRAVLGVNGLVLDLSVDGKTLRANQVLGQFPADPVEFVWEDFDGVVLLHL